MNVRPAQAVLNEIRGGELMTELASHLHDAAAAVKEFNKKATVTITIDINPASKEHLTEPVVLVVGEVSSKLPKADPPSTVFHIDEDLNLNRNASRKQETLPFAIANQPQG